MIGAGFRAVALDYDGTLTVAPAPRPETLSAVRAAREAGTRCILVTGRILAELALDFPGYLEHFDAVVAENGAVLERPGIAPRRLAEPVPPAVADELTERGVPLRRGDVILATDADHDDAVLDVIARLGLELDIERNRDALMVTPPGVTKATGVAEALRALDVSPHDTVAFGDAENDHALLDFCEVGVATANAVAALRERADVVLQLPDGTGVSRALRGEGPPLVSARHRLSLGTFTDGDAAAIPATGTSIGIFGESGSGKSHIAGLLAEQLVRRRYVTCIIDLEGDHVAIGALPGAVTVGGRERLPDVAEIVRLLSHGFVSVVVDLSLLPEAERRPVTAALLGALRASQAERGLPHWIFLEEAHLPDGLPMPPDGSRQGICLVTYRPEALPAGVVPEWVVTMDIREGPQLQRWGGTPRRLVPADRTTPHTRHWHKYAEGEMPAYRRFHFRGPRGLTGRTAANLPEFATEVARAPDDVLRHHAAGADFSRWIGDICRDRRVAAAVAEVESRVASLHDGPAAFSPLREQLIAAARQAGELDGATVPAATPAGSAAPA